MLSAKSFLQSFRRFASGRDLPSGLLSDNPRTFKPFEKNGPTLNCYRGRSRQPSAGSFKYPTCKDHNQWLTVIHLRGVHAGMQQYAEKSFEETLLRFWLWDYLRWGVSKVGSVRIVWLTLLTCSWTFCYSFYGVMNIYHVTSFTCACSACLRVRIWWIVFENWRVK